jgi:hypothetical protein
MKKRFHGMDRHKRYATIIVRDENGNEIQYISTSRNLRTVWPKKKSLQEME